jgi:predicted RNA-binding protein YlxR (DUF448 family)
MTKSKGRPRHLPERTCVACRIKGEKRTLIRLVRTPDGQIEVDSSGRLAGRGAYLCSKLDCWETALKRKSLNRALRTVLTSAEVARLREYAQRSFTKGVVEPPVVDETVKDES